MPHLSNSVLARRCKDGLKKFTNYRYHYPYKQILPPVLKNEVSRKGDSRGSMYSDDPVHSTFNYMVFFNLVLGWLRYRRSVEA